MILSRASECGSEAAGWTAVAAAASDSADGAAAGDGLPQLKSSGNPALCLAAGANVQGSVDPFCTAAANMWRTSTDTLQVGAP